MLSASCGFPENRAAARREHAGFGRRRLRGLERSVLLFRAGQRTGSESMGRRQMGHANWPVHRPRRRLVGADTAAALDSSEFRELRGLTGRQTPAATRVLVITFTIQHWHGLLPRLAISTRPHPIIPMWPAIQAACTKSSAYSFFWISSKCILTVRGEIFSSCAICFEDLPCTRQSRISFFRSVKIG